jgi:hypothetical protein
VLPLVHDPQRKYRPGWCSYSEAFADFPEVEIFCGGINSKTPSAAALWRQGNLLHFGFEQSPGEMNETGQKLLLNSIAYISRFSEDRPIAITPSVFAGPAPRLRLSVERLIENPDRDLGDLRYYATRELTNMLTQKDRAAGKEWLNEMRGFLIADEAGYVTVDEEAHAFGVAPNTLPFFEAAAAALKGETRERAARLLARYAPEGPINGTAEEWAGWFSSNRDNLFFSDAGGYRWYLDPLAKKRGVPSAELRGAQRADQ